MQRDVLQKAQKMLKEVIDEPDDITEEDISVYAQQLGIDPISESDLLWIAREGLKTPIPEPWCPVEDSLGRIYYYNKETRQSSWEHPLDPKFRALVEEERRKRRDSSQYLSEASEDIMSNKVGQKTSRSVRFDLDDDDFEDFDDFEASYEETEDVTIKQLPEDIPDTSLQDSASKRIANAIRPDDYHIKLRTSENLNAPGNSLNSNTRSDNKSLQKDEVSSSDNEEIIEESLSVEGEELESDKDATPLHEKADFPFIDLTETGNAAEVDLEERVEGESLQVHSSVEKLEADLTHEALLMEDELDKMRQKILVENEEIKAKLISQVKQEQEAYREEQEQKLKAEMNELIEKIKQDLKAQHDEKIQSLKQALEEEYRKVEANLLNQHKQRVKQAEEDVEEKLRAIVLENDALFQIKAQQLKEELTSKEASLQMSTEKEISRLVQDHETALKQINKELENKKALESETKQLQEEIQNLKTEIQTLKEAKQEIKHFVTERDALYEQLQNLRSEIEREQLALEELEREKIILITDLKALNNNKNVTHAENSSTKSKLEVQHSSLADREKESSEEHQEPDSVNSVSQESKVNQETSSAFLENVRIKSPKPVMELEISDIQFLKQRMSIFENHISMLSEKIDKVTNNLEKKKGFNPSDKLSVFKNTCDCGPTNVCEYCDEDLTKFGTSDFNPVLGDVKSKENGAHSSPAIFSESLSFMNDLPVVMSELMSIQKKMDNQFKVLVTSLKTNPRKFGYKDLQTYSTSSDHVDRSLRTIHKRVKELERRRAARHSTSRASNGVDQSANKDGQKGDNSGNLNEQSKPGPSNGNGDAKEGLSGAEQKNLAHSSSSSESLSELSFLSSSSDSIVDFGYHRATTRSAPLGPSTSTHERNYWRQRHESKRNRRKTKNPFISKYAEKTRELDQETSNLEHIGSTISNALRHHDFQEYSLTQQDPLNMYAQNSYFPLRSQKLNPFRLRQQSTSLPCIASVNHFENDGDQHSIMRSLHHLNKDINSMLEEIELSGERNRNVLSVPYQLPNRNFVSTSTESGRSISSYFSHPSTIREHETSNNGGNLHTQHSFHHEYKAFMEPIQKLRQELRSLESK